MAAWMPMTQLQLEQLIREQLSACTPAERGAYERIKIAMRSVPILRAGDIESVFAVGQCDGHLLIFEDVEGGFEWCRPDPDGVIRSYPCSQAGLQSRLYEVSPKNKKMPKTPALPESPEELLEQLFAIFPEFRSYGRPIHDETPTFHSVLLGFAPFFGASLPSFSERQLESLGALVSAAVAAAGTLENAFGTCFLEHLHQTKALRSLRPYLSKLAREKTKA